jgi:hypothetical protein
MSQKICREVAGCLRHPRKYCLCYFAYDKNKLCVVRLEVLTAVLLNAGVFWDVKGLGAFALRVTHSDLLGLLDCDCMAQCNVPEDSSLQLM